MTTPTAAATTETAAPATPLARQLLDDADRAFAAGELRRGYRLVWDAAMAALRPVAVRRGFPCETGKQAFEFVRHLDGIDENGHYEEYPYNYGGLSVSASFLEQSQGIYDEEYECFRWEGDQYEFYLPVVKWFIDNMIELADNDAEA